MKIVFAGTPDFATPTLAALLKSEHDVCAVLTQPDRPAGRGRQLTASPVKQLAQTHDIPIYQPERLDQSVIDTLRAYEPDLMIVVAYGQILPQMLLDLPKYGCINIHASLLPRWRGAAPIQHAILAGDQETGITLMQMNAGLDTGDILAQAECDIASDDTSASLHERLAELGAECLISHLPALARGEITPVPQDNTQATIAHKIDKQQALIEWSQPALTLARQVCAFNPWPVAYTYLEGERLRIWEAQALPDASLPAESEPGVIVAAEADGIDIVTGKGILKLTKVQLPNRQALPVSQLFHSNAWLPGHKLGADT